MIEHAGDGLLVALGLLLVWTAFRHRDARTLAGVLLTGVVTLAAYGLACELAGPCLDQPFDQGENTACRK